RTRSEADMRSEEFWRHLKKIRGWHVHDCGIRRQGCSGPECPVTAVANTVLKRNFSIEYFRIAGEMLGLDPAFVEKVAIASDDPWAQKYGEDMRSEEFWYRLKRICRGLPDFVRGGHEI